MKGQTQMLQSTIQRDGAIFATRKEETKVKPVSVRSRSKEPEALLDSSVSDAVKLKSRIQYLENRIEKHVHDYKTTAIEVERQIVDKFSELEQDNDKRLIYLQGQIESLRDGMIRLSNELKQLKESISSQK